MTWTCRCISIFRTSLCLGLFDLRDIRASTTLKVCYLSSILTFHSYTCYTSVRYTQVGEQFETGALLDDNDGQWRNV